MDLSRPAETPALLERDAQLAQLQAWLLELTLPGAPGRCLLLHGESGVGKSSLLHAARGLRPPRVDWLAGLCEPLLSPAPLGPLLDMLDELPPSLAAMLRSGRPVQQVMPEWLAWLRQIRRPLVLVVDDAQWADGASLDLLRFLGRRVESLRALLVLSFRDDELPPEHPLHLVFAGLPAAATLRQRLEPLSARAVAVAAQRAGRAAQGLHRLTQGNPFFLAELLRAPAGAMPASVRDAVLARAQRLTPAARRLLDLVCMSPVPLERVVLKQLLGEDLPGLAECLATGLLHEANTAGGEAIGFRHELARQAAASALGAQQRREAHHRLLHALPQASTTAGTTASTARRVHHAEGAGLAQEVLQLAPLAAAEAARAAAHRQAAALYQLAIAQCTPQTPAAQRAGLYVSCAEQLELIAELDRARDARQQAITLYRELGDRAGEGTGLSRMARLMWLLGDTALGKRLAREAIQVLESIAPPAPPGLAMAYAVMAQLHLLDATHGAARDWGRRAMQLAEGSADLETLAHALNTVGAAELMATDVPEGWARLRRSLALSLEQGWPELAARAYINLVVHLLVHRKHHEWPALCDEALVFCDARDFDLYSMRLRIRRAFGRIEIGQWAQAETDLNEVLALPGQVAMDRQQAQHLLALIELRRGRPAPRRYWAELLDGRRSLSPVPWYAPLSVAAAEAAWLLGRPELLLRWAQEGLPAAVTSGEPWRSGQLAVWLRRLGRLEQLPEIPLARPCEAELRGDLDAAAQGWGEVGNAYERGLSLLGGNVDQLKRALALFEQLGAAPAASLARRRLREAGVLTGLRGQNKATRADPMGLTPRQRRLLLELAQGLSYRDIAERWHRSPRTVEHHALHLLAKLGLGSRKEVVGFLQRSGEAVPSGSGDQIRRGALKVE